MMRNPRRKSQKKNKQKHKTTLLTLLKGKLAGFREIHLARALKIFKLMWRKFFFSFFWREGRDWRGEVQHKSPHRDFLLYGLRPISTSQAVRYTGDDKLL